MEGHETSTMRIHPGDGYITVSLHGHKAIFSQLMSTYPLKLLASHTKPDDIAVVYTISYGGGLVGGDNISLSGEVQTGATLLLLSQGSTKVFKTRVGEHLATVKRSESDTSNTAGVAHKSSCTTQTMTFVVESKSTMLLLPEPVTCFRDATYKQVQKFYLEEDSSLVLLDWITSGRKSLGEEWAFSRYYSRNEVWVGKRRIAQDVMLLASQAQDLGLPKRTLGDRLAPYSCYAMVILYGPKFCDTIRLVTKEYTQISVYKATVPGNIIWSLSPIHSEVPELGVVIRVAGQETEIVKHWMGQTFGGLQQIVGEDLYRRAFQ